MPMEHHVLMESLSTHAHVLKVLRDRCAAITLMIAYQQCACTMQHAWIRLQIILVTVVWALQVRNLSQTK